MVAWIVWLIVAAVLGVAELVTFTFALGLIAVGACVAAAVAALQLGLPFQLLAFVIASAAGLGTVLPIARRHVKQPPLLKTGPAALVGRSARVLEEVNGAQRPGPHRRRGVVGPFLRRVAGHPRRPHRRRHADRRRDGARLPAGVSTSTFALTARPCTPAASIERGSQWS